MKIGRIIELCNSVQWCPMKQIRVPFGSRLTAILALKEDSSFYEGLGQKKGFPKPVRKMPAYS